MRSIGLALRIWLFTGLVLGLGSMIYISFSDGMPFFACFIITIVSLIASLPVAVIMLIALNIINRLYIPTLNRILYFSAVCAACCIAYGTAAGFLIGSLFTYDPLVDSLIAAGILLACVACSFGISFKQLSSFFANNHKPSKQFYQMETLISEGEESSTPQKSSNRILLKAIITGILILVMLIPTIFITNLVKERKERQAAVASEVSSRWAQAQVLTGPYIFLPYKVIYTDKDKKVTEEINHLIILPDSLDVNGNVTHEIRQRSIYKVLLYRAALKNSGNFIFTIPKTIDSNLIQWKDAKICYGLSDFKGIEEKLVINFNGNPLELSPGLPSNDINEKGLSAPISLAGTDEGKNIPFNINVKIKGSEQLHFVPLAGDSRFTLQSDWNSPSFDGSDIPSLRNVTDKGFTATWSFNKANLPYGTILKDFKYDEKSVAFGVSLVQPADGYSKTDRCIKYAILFIGLTFSLFFIIELMQKKPVHPVQYILIGLALIIFFTLLLSMSEFIPFDYSYLIAAVAVILLITVYAYSHFKSTKTAVIFGGVLTLLYGFTFVLIRLEDTALLIGSIGLFIILAIAMYISKKINWYGEDSFNKKNMQIPVIAD